MERPRAPGPTPERLDPAAGGHEPGARAASCVVLCCGLTTLDVLQEVDAVPAPNEKTVARSVTLTFGGPAANAAATAVAVGATARLLTAIGSGPVADLVVSELADAGVDVVDLARGTGAVPAVSTILVTASTGERAVVSVNATRVGGLPAPPADALDGVDVVLVDGHHLETAIEVARWARAAGVPVVLDGGSWKPGLERLLALVDHAIVSADFHVPASMAADGPAAADLSRWTDDRERLVRQVASFGPTVVARSDGDRPILVLDPRTSAEVRSVPVPSDPSRRVVDTVGAGDVLHGAYAAFLACERPAADPATVLARAAGVASESVHSRGARGWVAGRRP
ncbi:sulfofructose kinase [mine drainage metagenome]|uniref:Sulfofructose kinase n=1 Tax=mine drainage metagenome TaxID=410659 RepID=A0A1J5QFB9_9ZZZZ